MISNNDQARVNRANEAMARDNFKHVVKNMLEVVEDHMTQLFEEIGITAFPGILQGRGVRIEYVDDKETNPDNPTVSMLKFTFEIPIPNDETIRQYKEDFMKESPIQIEDDYSNVEVIEHIL